MLGLLFLLIMVPVFLGIAIKRIICPGLPGYAPLYFVLGFAVMLAEFALICWPAVFLNMPLKALSAVVFLLYSVECMTVLILKLRGGKMRARAALAKKNFTEAVRTVLRSPAFWLMLILCAFQICRLIHFEPFEPRDSKTYNALVNDIVQTGRLYRMHHLVGSAVNSPLALQLKYILSPWYPFMSVASAVSGLHPLIITNTVMPAYVLFVHYLTLFALGSRLFCQEAKNTCLFVFICAFLREISVTISTPSIIEIVWPVWGKGVLASVIVPALLLLFVLFMSDDNHGRSGGFITGLLALSISGCALSTMSLVILPLELGLLGLSWSIKKKSLQPAAAALAVCIPPLIYVVTYVLLSRFK